MIGSCACGNHCKAGALESIHYRQISGDHINDCAGDEEWGNLARAAFQERSVGFLNQRQAAYPGTDIDADALCVLRICFEARILDRFRRSRDAIVDKYVDASRFLRRQDLAHIEVLHLSGNLRCEGCRVKPANPRDPGLARLDTCPCFLDVVADWTDDAQAGYDNSASRQRNSRKEKGKG
jgi:hypothetical protein